MATMFAPDQILKTAAPDFLKDLDLDSPLVRRVESSELLVIAQPLRRDLHSALSCASRLVLAPALAVVAAAAGCIPTPL